MAKVESKLPIMLPKPPEIEEYGEAEISQEDKEIVWGVKPKKKKCKKYDECETLRVK